MTDEDDAKIPQYDVLIVGGGLVGASLAIALDALNLKIGMLEAAPAGALPPVFDQRNLSFAEATVNALTSLGVLALMQQPMGAIRDIHVSRAGDFGRVKLKAVDYGRSEFGRVVVARDFGEALEARLAQLRHLTRYRPASFIGLEESGNAALRTVLIRTAQGEQRLQTKLLVAADGARSAVRSALHIASSEHDYQQTLFVARLRTQHAAEGQAYERLTNHGPTALLPRGDGYYGLVHGVATAEAESVNTLSDAAFLARVQAQFGWRAGRFLEVGARSHYPLVGCVAKAITAPCAVLVGNAAQSIHPLGAQGFNLGLRDALTLAECIAQQPGDPGAAALLAGYAERRMQDRQRTIAFSDGLVKLSSNPSALIRPLRSAGLLACDSLGWLQGWLAGGAMGYRGITPELSRRPA